jgi:hypothetical protein
MGVSDDGSNVGKMPQTLAVRRKFLGRIHAVEKKLTFVGVS